MNDTTSRKTRVPSTIHGVGVRAAFFSGVSGCWLSVRSSAGKMRQGPTPVSRAGPFGRW